MCYNIFPIINGYRKKAMNDVISDVKKLELETINNLKSSKAINTVRAYESDFKDFTLFCLKNGLQHLPTEPKILSIYLTHLSKTNKFSTLKRRIASIKVIHKMKGHYLDAKHPIIMENLLGIKRINGSYQKSKKPLLINDLKIILNVIDEKEKNEYKRVRNKSIKNEKKFKYQRRQLKQKINLQQD